MPIRIRYKRTDHPFIHPFTISKGTKRSQPALQLELDFFGHKGYGEASEISYYGITVEQMIADLEKKRPFIEKFAFNDPERFWHFLHHLFPDNSFLVCALDMAGWDLYGKMNKKPLYRLWGLDPAKIPPTDFTIGIDSVHSMIDKIKNKPWPVYKIKVGMEEDVEIIRRIREHTDAVIRVDANEGWSPDQAAEKIAELAKLKVQLVEQPLPVQCREEMKLVRKTSAIPLIADESCVSEHDVEKCKEGFHGINIKLTKCSGITPARRMIKRARSLGLSVMLGCMNESTVGTAALAHLAPLVDYADMDGTLLQSEQTGKGVQFEKGKFLFNQASGLGVDLADFWK